MDSFFFILFYSFFTIFYYLLTYLLTYVFDTMLSKQHSSIVLFLVLVSSLTTLSINAEQPPEPQQLCHFCGPNVTLPDPDDVPLHPNNTQNLTCGALEAAVTATATATATATNSSSTSITSTSCDLSQISLYQQDCCRNAPGTLLPPPPADGSLDYDYDYDYVDCPLCANHPQETPQAPYNIFDAGKATMTCQTAYDLGVLYLPPNNCTFWQDRGATICQCGAEPPTEHHKCGLCGTTNGNDDADDNDNVVLLPLPDPTRGLGDKICAEWQIRAGWDLPERCTAWQQTIGIYCGCETTTSEPAPEAVCRLCPTKLLPNPNHVLFLLASDDNHIQTSSSCGELEFQANLPGAAAGCKQYQTLYGEECCQEEEDLTDIQDSPDTSDGAMVAIQSSMSMRSVSTVLLAVGLVLVLLA